MPSELYLAIIKTVQNPEVLGIEFYWGNNSQRLYARVKGSPANHGMHIDSEAQLIDLLKRYGQTTTTP